jgi:Type IV secretion system pilin
MTRMKTLLSKFGAWVSVLPILFAPSWALAVAKPDPSTYLDGSGDTGVKEALGGTTQTLPQIVGGLINVLISVLGIIFVVLVVYAGFLYLTASGDDKKVAKAKTLLTQAVIGLVIILAAYGIATFVIDRLTDVAIK